MFSKSLLLLGIFYVSQIANVFCDLCNFDEATRVAKCEGVTDFRQIANEIQPKWIRVVIENKVGATVKIPDDIRSVVRLEELDFTLSGFVELTNSGFKAFRSLRKIIAPNGSFETIESDWFDECSNVVEYIDMSSNWITRLKREYFTSLKNIRELNFSGNDIYSIDVGTFSENLNLEVLDVSDTWLSHMNDLGNLPRLRYINLWNNDFLDVPNDAFENQPALETIILSSNSIQRIGDRTFKGLNHLRKLDLSSNSLREIYTYALDRPSLKILNLSTNEIKNVKPNSFRNLRNLRTLDLSNNSISYLDVDSFKGLRLLRNLFLQQNLVENLPTNIFANMPLIEDINLSQNMLKIFSGDVFGERDIPLRVLSLQNNSLCVVNPMSFQHTPNLEYLYLAYNKLKTLDPNLFSNVQLAVLHLQHNSLEEIPETIHDDFSTLTELLFNNNKLTFLPDGRELFQLEKIAIDDNPWQCACFAKIYNFIKIREIEQISNNHSNCADKPVCISAPEDVCIKDLNKVNQYKIVEKYEQSRGFC